MAKKTNKTGLIALIVLAFLIIYGCRGQAPANSKSEKEEDPPIPVEVTEVIKGSVSANYSGTATLEAEGEALVVAKVSGVIEKIFVEEGDSVEAGQVLAKLEDEEFIHRLAQVEARLEELANEFQRNKELFKNKLISAEAYDRTKYEYQTQEATYDLTKLNLNYTEIKAPISGIVSERFIKVGNMVTVNQDTFRVTDFDPLLAVLHVPEKELSKLKAGFPAELMADAIPGEIFSAGILRISPVISAETGTFKVTVAVTDETRKLKPGMFTRVNIVYDMHENALLLPKDAILTEDSESTVFIVTEKVEEKSEEEGDPEKTEKKEKAEAAPEEEGEEEKPGNDSKSETDSEPKEPVKYLVASKKEITIGYINSTHVEILSGVELGDVVVTTGLSTLKDGAKVKVVEK
ncbi:MAG: efflux RND transporter periplasmic adaptor subunit [Candidatus Aminicenantes bacterium]|nr:efflux RND transporter periplasmic adaptor subunit [Candidatus Aminicenantes bacterium]